MPRFADVLERRPDRLGLAGALAATRSHPDRALVTVAFIDIVGSTEKAVELGDVAWMELVHRFQRLVRTELRRHDGREVDTAGDGFFVTFTVPACGALCRGDRATRPVARHRCPGGRAHR